MREDSGLRAAIAWLEEQGAAVERQTPMGGGCIAEAWRLDCSDGQQFFVKSQHDAAADQFAAEAAGLVELARGGLRVPRVIAHGPAYLLLDWIDVGRPAPGAWQALGRELAQLHGRRAPHFGFLMDSFCGATRQPNPREDDGFHFFAEHRLRFQIRLAVDAGRLDASEAARVDTLCRQLPDRIPSQDPALLHGDLWSGNVLFAAGDGPVLVDPACYWGWPEADIAMSRLFGGFDEDFYGAWAETYGPEPGWERRLDVYNLYHLLNHLNLFGGHYRQSVRHALERLGV